MLIFAGWVNRHQQDVLEYLQAENQALREQLCGKRLRLMHQPPQKTLAELSAYFEPATAQTNL